MFASGQFITPVLPTPRETEYEELNDLVIEVVSSARALHAAAPDHVARPLATMLTLLNCYYSNLIEGNVTHLVDIERAMKNDYSHDQQKRNLQYESFAHVETERAMRQQLHRDPRLAVPSKDFICGLHKEFYSRLPEEFRKVTRPNGEIVDIIPGQIRQPGEEVKVGLHYAPEAKEVLNGLRFFEEQYSYERLNGIANRVMAIACAHHRLVYIHPFIDGNGRVSRLLATAMAIRSGIDSFGLWSVSRGLARQNVRYKELLATADAKKHFATDGRGKLSMSALCLFTKFFLETCLDQIQYMTDLLNLGNLAERIKGYVAFRAASSEPLHEQSQYILMHILATGGCDRATARRLTGLKDRAANEIIGQLLKEGLLTSEGQRQPLMLGLPSRALNYYFPNLYSGIS